MAWLFQLDSMSTIAEDRLTHLPECNRVDTAHSHSDACSQDGIIPKVGFASLLGELPMCEYDSFHTHPKPVRFLLRSRKL